MLGLVILKYFHPILDKKDPPEDKELYSIRLGHYRRLYPSSLVATELLKFWTKIENDLLLEMTNFSTEIWNWQKGNWDRCHARHFSTFVTKWTMW